MINCFTSTCFAVYSLTDITGANIYNGIHVFYKEILCMYRNHYKGMAEGAAAYWA